ncbi:pyridoxamine kinase [Petroclostridium sp. X23]|jgi:pyridoxine kinase|uniref:pyridoxamine kinase n=1 Tax=Petroclostridium sp. X23 TaxID=3045146 RepID=UPI0024AD0812|nr:pyridoxamine kinase [Petroclostridium sp. X23]WHH61192.1 pyridoxamine kinase [Petroclostridium sp. X23]
MKNIIPRIAAIHDLSGFGRCSLTVIIPILSAMGMQVCPLPTAVLSTHTGEFENYKFIDLTEHMEEYIAHWKSLDIKFNSIYSGFLGSSRQISIVADFINEFHQPDQLVVVDPVLGDDGELYATFDHKMVNKMGELVKLADIITPNITEAALLLNEPYPESIQQEELKSWILRLADQGPKTVIITSVPESLSKNKTAVVAYNSSDKRFWKVSCDYIPANYPGTGDVFTSVLVGSLLQGDSLPIALDRAVQFVSIAIRSTFGYQYPVREGVLIERVLQNLKAPVTLSSYEIL